MLMADYHQGRSCEVLVFSWNVLRCCSPSIFSRWENSFTSEPSGERSKPVLWLSCFEKVTICLLKRLTNGGGSRAKEYFLSTSGYQFFNLWFLSSNPWIWTPTLEMMANHHLSSHSHVCYFLLLKDCPPCYRCVTQHYLLKQRGLKAGNIGFISTIGKNTPVVLTSRLLLVSA